LCSAPRPRPHVAVLPLEGHARCAASRRPGDTRAADWYSSDELNVFRLSSKSHWDLPMRIDKETVHFLVSHPTPPVFDGPEDRNGTRNHDEIRFWADYNSGGSRAEYIYDDGGGTAGSSPATGS
jgi:hypothetical protein